jgi:hypothetical protein
MNDYRSALTKWNDNLNRNLALAYRYFGSNVWAFLSDVLYEEFAIIGRHLEDHYQRRHDPKLPPEGSGRLFISGRRLQALSNDIYDLNLVHDLNDPERTGGAVSGRTMRLRSARGQEILALAARAHR